MTATSMTSCTSAPRPVRDAVAGARNAMAASGVVLERYGTKVAPQPSSGHHTSPCTNTIQGQTGTTLLPRPGLRRHQADPCNSALLGEPDRQAAALAKARVIVAPVRHLEHLLGNVVVAVGICFERHRAFQVRGRAALLRRTARTANRQIAATTPVPVNVLASWCGPCRAMVPAFEAAAAKLEPHMRRQFYCIKFLTWRLEHGMNG